MPNRPIEELQAGDAFRRTLKPRADSHNGPAPLWHGWAIMDAFLAGIDWARQRPSVSVDAEFYVGGVRYDAGEYIIKRVGPPKPDVQF